MSSQDTVPYFVLSLKDGRTKAVFTVPEDLVAFLTAHPILCRGGSFDLKIDVISQRANSGQRKTSFLSTEFYSPEPEMTASEISQRIAVRMENSAVNSSSSSLDAGALLLS